MFTELMPMIEQRPLTITVAVLNGGRRIRVNVVPQTLEKDGKVNDKIHKDKIAEVPDEVIKALTTPLSLTGTAEEIDAELAQALRNSQNPTSSFKRQLIKPRSRLPRQGRLLRSGTKIRSRRRRPLGQQQRARMRTLIKQDRLIPVFLMRLQYLRIKTM